jgi:DNA 3'-phosphatase
MWIYEEDNKLLYFISKNFSYRPNVAIFSLCNTLIKNSIGKNNIKFMEINDIIPTLKQIDSCGSIVIIENGSGISRENLKLITKKFFDLIDNENNSIPFIIMFPLKNNKFQKPYTHIFNRLQHLYAANEKIIINEASIVVGNAAGRIRVNSIAGDKSDHDRAFASNIDIMFKTASQFFNNNTIPRQWKWSYDINKILTAQKSLIDKKLLVEPRFEDIFFGITEKFIVFIAGPPTSGKTLLGNRITSYFKSIEVGTTTYDSNKYTVDQMLLSFKESIYMGENIIIIDTFESNQKRNYYLSVINNYKIFYIEIDIKRDLCEFLNVFRLQISKNIFEKYPKYIYNNYYTHYRSINSIKFPLIIRPRKELFYHY